MIGILLDNTSVINAQIVNRPKALEIKILTVQHSNESLYS
jgi:hypothetical protein